MNNATFHATENDLQSVLERVYLTPDKFTFDLKGNQVYLSRTGTEPFRVGEIETGEIPAVHWSNLKIKSWRLNKSEKEGISLSLKLII
jgi:hypothetical protein